MAHPLPHPELVVEAFSWLRSGAPVVSSNYDSKEMVKVLIDLMHAIPAHIPLYCYGSPEWRQAMGLPPKDP